MVDAAVAADPGLRSAEASALRAVVADRRISHSGVRMYAFLVLSSDSGEVEGLPQARLADGAGMAKSEAARALKELEALGLTRVHQPRPYAANRYILAFDASQHPVAERTPEIGSGPRGEDDRRSPQPLSIERAGAPRPPRASDRRRLEALYADGSDPEPSEAELTDPMRQLVRHTLKHPPVWHMVRNPPDGCSPGRIYLVYILLTRVERRTPPRYGVGWPDLEEMLRSGVLEQSGTYSALRSDIEKRSQIEGFEIQAEAELALLTRELVGGSDANP